MTYSIVSARSGCGVAARQHRCRDLLRIYGTIFPLFTLLLLTASPAAAQIYLRDKFSSNNSMAVNASGQASVICANCSGSGASAIDQATAIPGTSVFAPSGGFFQTTATNNALTNLQQGMMQMTANRALFVNFRNASGTEIGTSANPIRVDPTGTTAQAVTQSGTWTMQPGNTANTTPWLMTIQQGGNVANVNASGQLSVISTGGSGFSQTDTTNFTPGVSLFASAGGFFQTTPTSAALANGQMGTFQVTANRALFVNLRNAAGTEIGTSSTPVRIDPTGTTTQPMNLLTINGVTPLVGNGVTGNGSLRVTIASDNTSNTNAFLVTGTGGTFPVTCTNCTGTVTVAGSGNFNVVGTSSDNSANSTAKLAVLVGRANAAAPTWTEGNMVPISTDLGGNIRIAGGSGGVSATDQGIYTQGASFFTPIGCEFNNVVANLATGTAGAVTCTAARSMNVNVTNGSTIDPAGNANVNIQASLPAQGLVVSTPPIYQPRTNQSVTMTTTGALRADVSGSSGVLIAGLAPVGATPLGNPVRLGVEFNSTQPTVTTGQMVGVQGTARGAMIVGTGADTFNVTCSNCSGSGVSQTDEAAWTAGSSLFVSAGGVFNDSAAALTSGQMGTVRMTNNRAMHHNLRNAAGTEVGTASTPLQVSLANTAANATAVSINTASATGAAVPANAFYSAGNGSGNLTGIIVCDNWFKINQTTGTQIISGTSSKKTYICSINIVTAAAQNVAIVGGTGAVCGTNTEGVSTGGTTAATGWNFAANGGLSQGTGVGVIMRAETAAENVCILQSGSGQLSGTIAWTQL